MASGRGPHRRKPKRKRLKKVSLHQKELINVWCLLKRTKLIDYWLFIYSNDYHLSYICSILIMWMYPFLFIYLSWDYNIYDIFEGKQQTFDNHSLNTPLTSVSTRTAIDHRANWDWTFLHFPNMQLVKGDYSQYLQTTLYTHFHKLVCLSAIIYLKIQFSKRHTAMRPDENIIQMMMMITTRQGKYTQKLLQR